MLNSLLKLNKQNKTLKQAYQFCSQSSKPEKQQKTKVLFGGNKKKREIPTRPNDNDDYRESRRSDWYSDNAKDFSKVFGSHNKYQGKQFNRGGQQQNQNKKKLFNNRGSEILQPTTQIQGQFLNFLDKDNNKDQQQKDQKDNTNQQQQVKKPTPEEKRHELQIAINKFESLEKSADNVENLMDLYSLTKNSDKVVALYQEYHQNGWNINEAVDNLMFENVTKLGYEQAFKHLNEYVIANDRLKIIYKSNVQSYIQTILDLPLTKIEIAQKLNEFLAQLKESEIQVQLSMDIFTYFIQDLELIKSVELLQITETFLDYFNYVLQQKTDSANKETYNISLGEQNTQNTHYLLNLDHLFSVLVEYEYPLQKVGLNSKVAQQDLTLYFFETALKANIPLSYQTICRWLYTYLDSGKQGIEMIVRVANSVYNGEKAQRFQQQNQQQNNQDFYQIFLRNLNEYYQTNGEYPFNAEEVERIYQNKTKHNKFLSIFSIQILQFLATQHKNSQLVFLIYNNFDKLRTPSTYECLINSILNSEIENNKYRQTVKKVLEDARNNNIIINNKFKMISEIKAQVLENYPQEAAQMFTENFIKPNLLQYYKLKIKYFFMQLIKQQEVSVEYQISQSFINKFVNSIPNKKIQSLINDDAADNTIIKVVLDHINMKEEEIPNTGSNRVQDNENMHTLRKENTLQDNFMHVRARVIKGELSEADIPRLKKIEDQLHYDEIYILQNFEQMEKNYLQQLNLKRYMDDYHLLNKKFDARKQYTTPGNLPTLTENFERDAEEIKILVNKLLERDQNSPIDEEYQQYTLRRSYQQLRRIINLLSSHQREPQGYRMKQMTPEIMKEAILLHPELYQEADNLIFIQDSQVSQNMVKQFCQWGIDNNQPICVLLAEKYFYTIGQQIPNYLAQNVSDFFERVAFSDGELGDRQKTALKFVQLVERNKIYDLSQNLKHIAFNEFQEKTIEEYIEANPKDRFKGQYLNFRDKSLNRYQRFGLPPNFIEQQSILLKQQQQQYVDKLYEQHNEQLQQQEQEQNTEQN